MVIPEKSIGDSDTCYNTCYNCEDGNFIGKISDSCNEELGHALSSAVFYCGILSSLLLLHCNIKNKIEMGFLRN